MTEQNEQTKKCPKCKEAILADAKKCKHCGGDLRNWFVRHKIITGFLVLIVLGIFMSAIGENSPSSGGINPPVEQKEESIKITARELYAAYEANAIQADGIYKDRLLEVSGIIENIGKDILDDSYVALKTNNPIGSIQCMLADSEIPKAAQLQKGSPITLEGKNSGKLMNIILRNCIIK